MDERVRLRRGLVSPGAFLVARVIPLTTSSFLRHPLLLRLAPALMIVAVGAVIVGARWELIARYATAIPQADQWDAEGLAVLAPWQEGHLSWSAFWQQHNEHRVILSKAWALAWVQLNGQWDQRLLCFVNALLPAAIAMGLIGFARRFLPAVGWVATATLLAVGFALPHAWHNTLSGFHSQQFFLIGLSALTIIGCAIARVGSVLWWLALASAALVLGSMASGLLAPALGGMLLLLRWHRRELSAPVAGAAALWCFALAVFGALTRPHAPHHAFLQATSVQEFVLTFLRGLRWPAQTWGWIGLALWVPWCVLLVRRVRLRMTEAQRHADAVLALGAWVVLQLAATAYARGAGASDPAIRYYDTLLIGGFANLAALGLLVVERPRWSHAWLATAGVTWGTLWFGPLLLVQPTEWRRELVAVDHHNRVTEHNVRLYLASGDESHLVEPFLPYPWRKEFLERVNRPSLRALLPASVLPPPATVPALSRTAQEWAAQGRVIWTTGLVLALAGVFVVLATAQQERPQKAA